MLQEPRLQILIGQLRLSIDEAFIDKTTFSYESELRDYLRYVSLPVPMIS